MSDRAETVILIIDDEQERLEQLDRILRSDGFEVRAAETGTLALQFVERDPPDLILVNPAMTEGYDDAWARLKAHEHLREVPVIHLGPIAPGEGPIGSLGQRLEFLTEPFVAAEVRARARSALEIRRLQQALERSEAVARGFIAMLVHDVRSPLSSIMLNLEMVGQGSANLTEDEKEDIAYALSSARSLAAMMSIVVDVGRLESGQMTVDPVRTDLTALASEAISRLRGPTAKRVVEVEADPELPTLCCRETTRRVIEQLLDSAFAFTPQGKPVSVRLLRRDDRARLEVVDDGPRIPHELGEKIFDRVGLLEVRRTHRAHSRGVGPIFCKVAIEAQRGTIGVSAPKGEPEDRGNTFWFELPLVLT